MIATGQNLDPEGKIISIQIEKLSGLMTHGGIICQDKFAIRT